MALSVKNRLYASWTRCNHMVLSWLLNSIHRELRDSVIYSGNAADVWIELHEQFSEGNATKIYHLRNSMINHLQEHNHVAVYYN